MWKNINVNKQNVKVESAKAVLIQMPHNSDYDGYSFWHPAKLVRTGRNSNAVSIGYTEEFTFKLVKYGSGKWNSKEIVSEKTISVEEFEAAFGVMDENITTSKKDTESYLKVEEPKKIEKEVAIAECLKNNN